MAFYRTIQKPGSDRLTKKLRNQRERECVFVAYSDSITDTMDGAVAAVGVDIGTPYAFLSDLDTRCKCQEVHPRRTERLKAGGYAYEISCKYATRPPGEDDQEQNNGGDPDEPSPFKRPPDVSWKGGGEQRPLERAYKLDANGAPGADKVPVRNSAGGRFSKVPTAIDPWEVLVVAKNEPYFPRALSRDYRHVSNSDTFLGDAAGYWIVNEISGQKVWEEVPAGTDLGDNTTTQADAEYYWRVTYELFGRAIGWDVEMIDEGMEAFENINGSYKLVRPRDAKGIPLAGPVSLDGEGQRMDDTTLKTNGPHMLKFRARAWKAFSALGIASAV